jgi:hypothetical protein
MAVPKKRRINSKFLNKGFKNNYAYSRMFNSTVSRLYLSYLSRLVSKKSLYISTRGRGDKVNLIMINTVPVNYSWGEEFGRTKNFHGSLSPFSYKVLKVEFCGYNINSLFKKNQENYMGPMGFGYPSSHNLIRYSMFRLTRPESLILGPSPDLTLKRAIFLFQVDHRWGSQSNLLLKK